MYPLLAKRKMLVIWTWIFVASISLLNMNIANPIQAETGKGEDIFKVIMTIFDVDKSKGDVVAIVTANNGEASRVKFLDSEAPYVVPINSSGGRGRQQPSCRVRGNVSKCYCNYR